MTRELLVLPGDHTSRQDVLVTLVVSVVYCQHAISVAWHSVGPP